MEPKIVVFVKQSKLSDAAANKTSLSRVGVKTLSQRTLTKKCESTRSRTSDNRLLIWQSRNYWDASRGCQWFSVGLLAFQYRVASTSFLSVDYFSLYTAQHDSSTGKAASRLQSARVHSTPRAIKVDTPH